MGSPTGSPCRGWRRRRNNSISPSPWWWMAGVSAVCSGSATWRPRVASSTNCLAPAGARAMTCACSPAPAPTANPNCGPEPGKGSWPWISPRCSGCALGARPERGATGRQPCSPPRGLERKPGAHNARAIWPSSATSTQPASPAPTRRPSLQPLRREVPLQALPRQQPPGWNGCCCWCGAAGMRPSTAGASLSWKGWCAAPALNR